VPRGSSPKRERQYEHIKQAKLDDGASESEAEEIAARTVNKARARSGEAKESSKLSKKDISSQRRAAHRRTHGGSGRTKAQLYEEAKDRNIAGRSKMSKRQLQNALSR
jgi:hypothetical protein